MLKTPGSPPASAPSDSNRSSEQPRGHAALTEVALHEVAREAVDARRHRRVRREHRARAHDLERMLGVDAVLHQHAHALHREQAGVALVHVEDGGLDAAGGERLDAADAEQDLLAQAVLAVAAVEAVGDRALGRRVGLHVGVEQQQLDPADVDAPEPGVQRTARAAPRRRAPARPPAASTGVIGSSAGSSSTNSSSCAPLGGQQLAEVAVAVEEADADDRHAEVAGRLEVVAGEDAEPARVLRQRLAEAELGREVGDGARRIGQRRVPAGRRQALVQPGRGRRRGARGSRRRRASSASRAGEAPASIPTGLPEAAARPPGSTSASTDAIWASHVQARLRASRSSGSRPSGSGTLVDWSGGGVMASLPGVVQRASWKRFAARAAWHG